MLIICMLSSSTDSTWIDSWCIPGIITSAGTESILKLGQGLQLAPEIPKSRGQALPYFYWSHVHIYTLIKTFCFCEFHHPRITQLPQRQCLLLGNKPPNRHQGSRGGSLHLSCQYWTCPLSNAQSSPQKAAMGIWVWQVWPQVLPIDEGICVIHSEGTGSSASGWQLAH